MYYVYKIEFPELNALYIGCTNNLCRRKNQHNENARTGKSYLGRFMSENNITLSKSDLQIIGKYEHRQDALDYERNTAMSFNDKPVHLLNDNYSNHSSRKGMPGASNPSAKEYVVVDTKAHTTTRVDDMHGWCKEHDGVTYKTLIGTAKRKPFMHKGRYVVRSVDEWDSMSQAERDELVSGQWYEKVRAESEKTRVSKISKTYLLKTPNGFMFVKNLDKFANEHGINAGNLHASYTTGLLCNGYKVVERIA